MPYHNLDVYKKSYAKSLEIHRLSLKFPQMEKYELARQLRKSTKSIPVNIAEGMGRQISPPDVVQFLRMSLGSCDETRIWLEYARDLGYIPKEVVNRHYDGYCEIGRMINGLIKKWASK